MNQAANELETLLKDLTSTKTGRRAFLAAVPLLMAACATDRHRLREGDNTDQQTEMTVEDEKKMTAEVLPEMRKQYPAVDNPELQNYVTGLGRKIVAANGLENHPYSYNFTVVGVPYVNAFALPAGTVFVTAPLLQMAETESELAGVIGHEIGHIKARHTAERMDKQKKESSKSWLYAVGGGLLGGAAGFGLGKLLCAPKDNACLAKAAGIGAAAGAAGGFLVQKFAFMANSQEDEMEADRIGFRVATKAGYDKDHVGTFYAKLLQMEQQHKQTNTPIVASIADAMSTHPPSRERVSQMDQMAGEMAKQPSPVITSKAFDKARGIADQWVKANKKG